MDTIPAIVVLQQEPILFLQIIFCVLYFHYLQLSHSNSWLEGKRKEEEEEEEQRMGVKETFAYETTYSSTLFEVSKTELD